MLEQRLADADPSSEQAATLRRQIAATVTTVASKVPTPPQLYGGKRNVEDIVEFMETMRRTALVHFNSTEALLQFTEADDNARGRTVNLPAVVAVISDDARVCRQPRVRDVCSSASSLLRVQTVSEPRALCPFFVLRAAPLQTQFRDSFERLAIEDRCVRAKQ